MKTALSATLRLSRGPRHAAFSGLFVFVSIGASYATAKSGGDVMPRLDPMAGAGVCENRAGAINEWSGRPILVPPCVYTGAQGSGEICSTAEDVITWLKVLHGGKVLTPKSYAEMIMPA